MPCEGYEPCTPCSMTLVVEPGARISLNLPAGMDSSHAPCGFQELNVVSHWTLIVQTGLSTTNILPFLKQNGHCTLAHISGCLSHQSRPRVEVLFSLQLSFSFLFLTSIGPLQLSENPPCPGVLVVRTATAADGWPI